MAGNLPQVGLEAIIAGLPGFTAGANTINAAYDAIEKKASAVEKASSRLGSTIGSRLGSTIGSISSPFVDIGQSVLKFGAIAGGVALAGVTTLSAGIVALGVSAAGEFAKYERLSLSIQNLVAREISQGQVVEQQVQTRIQLTKSEAAELSGLPAKIQAETLSRTTLGAQIQEQKQRIIELTAAYGDNGLNVQTAKAKLAEMENQYNTSSVAIDTMTKRVTDLNTKNGESTTTLQKVRTGQMTMSEAMDQAIPKTQELLKWTQLTAIQSPFNQEGIANAFQTALAYGFTTDEAQRLTNAEVDFAAATGKGVEATGQIALALGQMQAKGKVSGQEIIQLTNAGVGVNKILSDMGFTLDDVSAGLVDSDTFINAVIKDMEVFKGAAKSQSGTFAGLIASLEDLKAIGLREFFTGTFQAIQPYLAGFVDFLTNAALETGGIKKLGDALGQYVGDALKNIGTFIAVLRAGGLAVFSKYLGVEGIPLWYTLQKLIGNITKTISGLSGTVKGPLSSAFSYITTNALPTITKAIAFVNDNFESFKGALMGIGTVMAVGVFAAIAAGILSLLTPINLIIAGAALLGAAWAGDWYGIQEIVYSAWATIQPIFDMLKQRADLVIFTFEKFGASQGFAVLGQQIVSVINQMIPGFANVVLWLQTNIPIAIQAVSTFWTNILMPAMMAVGAWITGTLIPTLGLVWGWLQTNIPVAIQYLSDFWSTVLMPALVLIGAYIVNTIIPTLTDLWGWIQNNLPMAIQFVSDVWKNYLGPALVEVESFITGTLVPTLTTLTEWLMTNIPVALTVLTDMWSNKLLPAINSVWSFFNAYLMPLWISFIGFVNAVFSKELEALAGIWQNILLPALQDVWKFMQDNVLPIFVSAGEKLSGEEGLGPILKNMAENVLPVFRKAMDGVKNAIKEATDFFKSLASAVSNFELPPVLTPGSPTPLETALTGIANAANQAGTAMQRMTISQTQIDKILGLNRTIASNANITQQATKSLARFYEARGLETNKRNLATKQLTNVFKANQAQIMGAIDPVAMFKQIAKQSGALGSGAGFSGNAYQIAQGGFGAFLQGFRDATNRLKKLQQEALIEAGRTALNVGNRLNDVVSSSVDILDSRVETLQALVDSGLKSVNYEGQIISATRAQQLLNQALREQASIQDDILQLKQNEQKLNFLEKQLDLIETINDAGLNVQDILGGLTLGLNASIPDMIEATNRLVMAMINQVNRDLQIHSPSKVMTGLFKQAGLGAVRGLLDTVPMIRNVASEIGNAVINVPMGQANPANNSTVNNNYNFSMTVPTQASPQGVIRQYQTMRAMVS